MEKINTNVQKQLDSLGIIKAGSEHPEYWEVGADDISRIYEAAKERAEQAARMRQVVAGQAGAVTVDPAEVTYYAIDIALRVGLASGFFGHECDELE